MLPLTGKTPFYEFIGRCLIQSEKGCSPSAICPLCKETFSGRKTVVMTSCKHLYHIQCLKEFLATNNHCPLCQKDISVLERPLRKHVEVPPDDNNSTYARNCLAKGRECVDRLDKGDFDINLSDVEHILSLAHRYSWKAEEKEEARNLLEKCAFYLPQVCLHEYLSGESPHGVIDATNSYNKYRKKYNKDIPGFEPLLKSYQQRACEEKVEQCKKDLKDYSEGRTAIVLGLSFLEEVEMNLQEIQEQGYPELAKPVLALCKLQRWKEVLDSYRKGSTDQPLRFIKQKLKEAKSEGADEADIFIKECEQLEEEEKNQFS